MRINLEAAKQGAAEKKSTGYVYPNGWYKVVIRDVEDSEGKDSDSRSLRISAKVYKDGAEVTERGVSMPADAPKSSIQKWNVNYVKRDGSPNKIGMSTVHELVIASGAQPDGDGEIDTDDFEGARVWARLGRKKAEGDYPEKNEVRQFSGIEKADEPKQAPANEAPTPVDPAEDFSEDVPF